MNEFTIPFDDQHNDKLVRILFLLMGISFTLQSIHIDNWFRIVSASFGAFLLLFGIYVNLKPNRTKLFVHISDEQIRYRKFYGFPIKSLAVSTMRNQLSI
jgi:hypothetical protein